MLPSILGETERVLLIETVQVKGVKKAKRAAVTVAGAVASVATLAATGGAVSAGFTAYTPACWFVATTQRILLISRPDWGMGAGVVQFAAPRSELAASRKSFILNEVTVTEATSGEPAFRLNLGVKRSGARRVVAAVQGQLDANPMQPGMLSRKDR